VADFVFTNAKRALLAGELDLDAQSIRIALLMTNHSLHTAGQEDVATISAITTLDEYNGAGYVRKTLAGLAVAAVNASDWATFDATDVLFSALGAGTRSAAGILLFRFITNDTDNVPIAWIESGGFPIAGNGGDLNVVWDALGILRLA
jgi:hypothetical protein